MRRWQPAPAVAGLVTPMFRQNVVSRLVTASVSHAHHVLDNLGRRATEPGPHALVLLSAEPQRREPEPERPSWWSPALPDADTPQPAALVHVASRLIGIGDGDDLLQLLSDLTAIAARDVDAAAATSRLLHQHDAQSRANIAAGLTQDQPWTSAEPFPYAQALAQGALWDPRTPDTGLAPTSKTPLTTDIAYIGVAVSTLDRPAERWVDSKETWRGARDPEFGMPVNAGSLPGTVWAVLEDGTALHIERTPTPREARIHHVVSNAPVVRGFDRITALEYRRRLVDDSPPLPRLPRQPAQLSADLWDHLGDLHTVLRSAFGYEGQA